MKPLILLAKTTVKYTNVKYVFLTERPKTALLALPRKTNQKRPFSPPDPLNLRPGHKTPPINGKQTTAEESGIVYSGGDET
jgi:hypothetical protein